MASSWRKLRQAHKQLGSASSPRSKQFLIHCTFFLVAFLGFLFYWTSGSLFARNVGLEEGRSDLNSASRMQDHKGCDYATGRWVYDPHFQAPYNESCSDIFKGWNCIRNQRSNAGEYLHWRWKPDGCELHRLNPQEFLTRFRGKNIGFVGDSLNRNMYASFVCMLKQAASKELKKWRPFGADKGITFLQYNITVAYHRTNLLAHYGEWKAATEDGPLEKLGFKEGFRVDVDVPQASWIQAPHFYDVLVISTGHWWFAPNKFNPVTSPLLFFENGKPLLPPVSPETGLDITLKHMLDYVGRSMKEGGVKILRSQSPRHFEGGDWNEGGKCHRSSPLNSAEVEGMFSLEGVNSEARIVNQHLLRAASSGSSSFKLLNISHMSEFRADGHPSVSAKKLHEDCMHWCLPGVTDSWNDLLATAI